MKTGAQVRVGAQRVAAPMLCFLLCMGCWLVALSAGLSAGAQTATPDAVESVSTEEISLVSSKTEVRRAVFGLLGLAGVLAAATGLYWYKTGQAARLRAAAGSGGSATGTLSAPAPAAADAVTSAPSAPANQKVVAGPVVRPGASVFDVPPAAARPAPAPAPSVFGGNGQGTANGNGSATGRSTAPSPASSLNRSRPPSMSDDDWWAAVTGGPERAG